MRPLIVPQPVTTPSPAGRSFSMPKSVQRWATNMSNSSNEPSSSRSSIRSRAVSLPLPCCAAMRLAPPPMRAPVRRDSSSSRISCISALPCRATLAAGDAPAKPDPAILQNLRRELWINRKSANIWPPAGPALAGDPGRRGTAFLKSPLREPAGRIGLGHFSAAGLEAIRRLVTRAIFAGIPVPSRREPLARNRLAGLGFVAAGAVFVFPKR